MSERLKDLQRQRALAQEQVDWFDRQIAAETGAATPPAAAAPAGPQPAAPASAPAAHDAEAAADRIMAQYREQSKSKPADIKRGCILYFVFGLGLLGIAFATVYILYTRR
ncbi:MAG: hypothetical protein JNG83_05550 [Opitutaceae bacterium]|nr:hypothetical protein [Opitutaceae bacterium]